MFVCSEKHRISRDDITVGGILGEGFFGEVHNGVYKSPVSRGSLPNVTLRIKIKSFGPLSCNAMQSHRESDACVCVFADRREDLRGHQNV